MSRDTIDIQSSSISGEACVHINTLLLIWTNSNIIISLFSPNWPTLSDFVMRCCHFGRFFITLYSSVWAKIVCCGVSQHSTAIAIDTYWSRFVMPFCRIYEQYLRCCSDYGVTRKEREFSCSKYSNEHHDDATRVGGVGSWRGTYLIEFISPVFFVGVPDPVLIVSSFPNVLLYNAMSFAIRRTSNCSAI